MNLNFHYVTRSEIHGIRKYYSTNETLYIVQIDGKTIRNLNEYLKEISTQFQFPIPTKGLDGYLDWMRDLSWLKKDGYVLIIDNYSDFLSEDFKNKDCILKIFDEDLIPWWEFDVKKHVVDGHAKTFKVYLVEN